MQVRLNEIHEEPYAWTRTESVPAAELDRSELVALGPIEWSGTISRVPPGFLLRAQLDYRQTLACDRCLREIEDPVSDHLELLIEVQEENPEGGERELDEEDLGTLRIIGDVLDTGPLLREQLQLNIPMKPLCRPDCKGLCPTCGNDRNREPCDCEDEKIDPRWAALAALRPPD